MAISARAVADMLAAAAEARGAHDTPLFLKVAPDLDDTQVGAICDAALASKLAGLIISNTTLARPATLRSVHASETGGLSGAPLRDPATAILRQFSRRIEGRLPLIGAGGISSAEDAYARIRAGASAVQLYTAMLYEGPGLPTRIAKGLSTLLRRDGFRSVAEAVGTESD